MAHLLGAEALSIDFGTGPVLTDVSVGLDDGDRIGIVGANGAGKSSLLAVLAGRLEPHGGRVTAARGVRVGVVDQTDDLPPGATVATAIVGDADEHEWAGDPRVRDIMAGLVPDLPADKDVDTLSGGQRRRVALARVLVGDHDVVFLDEPTNHLDVDGVAWLAEHLRTRWGAGKGALAVITHDRWFLDAVCSDTWEVHDATVDKYEGGYAAWVLQKVERERVSIATEQKRQNKLRKELAWLRRGAPARTSKPKFRIDAANALIADVPELRDTVALVRMAASRLGKEVVTLERCSVEFGEGDGARRVLHQVDWRIGPGERTGILGENGAGKSTLLRLITGDLEPTSGHVKRGTTVTVASLTQHLKELDEVADERIRTVVKRYQNVPLADGTEMSPGQLLERLGFTSAQLSTPVKKLSGGQRRRLQMLMVLLSNPNVLVLDEPTNDLDTDTLAALEDLLDSWPGTLIVVSHDRYLMERITDQQYAVIDGGLRHLPGGVEEYVKLSRQRRASRDGLGSFGGKTSATPAEPAGAEPAAAGGRERKRTRSSSAPQRPEFTGAERRTLEKEAAAIERRLDKLRREVTAAGDAMAAHDAADYEGLQRLAEDARAKEAERDELETRWLEISEALG